MKSEKNKILPTIQWVQPVPPQSLLLRSIIIENEKSTEQTKPFVMFNEIFPAKNAMKIFHNANSAYEQTDDTFHRAISPVLTVGQFFGIMPITGVRKPEASNLKFIWMTWRVMFSLLVLAASGMVTVLSIIRIAYTGIDIFKTTSTVFFGSTCIALAIFLRLAIKWPVLSASIAHRERNNILRTHPNRRSLRSRFRICCFAILFPALVEHVLAVFSGAVRAYDCHKERSILETYFMNSYAQIYYFFDYSLWNGVIAQFINLESTFNWNFMDLFVIVFSLGLTDRFDQLNERIEAVKGKHLPDLFWKTARQEYAHLSQLVKEVDTHINEIVLLSFANNLYFICLQLFNSLNNVKEEKPSNCGNTTYSRLRGLSQVIYFTFSFGFLMIRSLAVSLSAARIHSSSRRPAVTLYAAPSSSYGIEIQRFLDQVVSDTIALSGLNFFNVTRGLVLTIAGTIVTYELVLVQFYTAPPSVQANITISETCGTVPITT